MVIPISTAPNSGTAGTCHRKSTALAAAKATKPARPACPQWARGGVTAPGSHLSTNPSEHGEKQGKPHDSELDEYLEVFVMGVLGDKGATVGTDPRQHGLPGPHARNGVAGDQSHAGVESLRPVG